MFCASCGSPNDDNAYACTSCGKRVVRSGEIMPADAPDSDPVAGQVLGPVAVPIVLSIFVSLFCCQPLGLIAVVFAAIAIGKNSAGAYSEADRNAKTARKLAWTAFGIGLAVWLGYIAVATVTAFSQPSPRSGSTQAPAAPAAPR